MSYIEEILHGLAERERKAHAEYLKAHREDGGRGLRREALRRTWQQVRRQVVAAKEALRRRGGDEEAREVCRIWRALAAHRANI